MENVTLNPGRGVGTMGHIPAPASKKEAPQKVEHHEEGTPDAAEATPVDHDTAKSVAGELNKMALSHRGVRFSVEDPGSSGVGNVVIQIMNAKNEVIAEIPSKEVRALAKAIAEDALGDHAKGLVYDANVG